MTDKKIAENAAELNEQDLDSVQGGYLTITMTNARDGNPKLKPQDKLLSSGHQTGITGKKGSGEV